MRSEADELASWCRRFIATTDLEEKLHPGPPPAPGLSTLFREGKQAPGMRGSQDAASRGLPAPAQPGRPPELRVQREAVRAHRGQLRSPRARARLLHTFFHHELQAAELLAWAVLRFPDTPPEFRAGLTRICLDEVRHMRLYVGQLHRLGFRVGDFPVRDWFWERLSVVTSPVAFVASLGMGFEAANLDHSQRFAARFRAAGDEEAARVQEKVGREEIAHVDFARSWFERWTGGQDFNRWRAELPEPLSPLLMRGAALAEDARRRAGLEEAFLTRLKTWSPSS